MKDFIIFQIRQFPRVGPEWTKATRVGLKNVSETTFYGFSKKQFGFCIIGDFRTMILILESQHLRKSWISNIEQIQDITIFHEFSKSRFCCELLTATPTPPDNTPVAFQAHTFMIFRKNISDFASSMINVSVPWIKNHHSSKNAGFQISSPIEN